MAEAADPLPQELAGIVGASHVVSDASVLAGRLRDWTGRWRGSCRCAVSPADGAEVAAVLRACAAANAHVVIQGGNTGLVGGAVPEAGDVLLLTARLRDLEPPDEVAHTVVVGAGVTLAELQQHLRPYGLELPVDLAARQTASIGGMVATNAGGLRVLHDGDMRRQVLSVDAYAADGQHIAVLHPLVKDNTGYALSALLVGSEGTLAVITRVLLRVVARSPAGAVVVIGLPDLERAISVVGAVRREVAALRAVETVSHAVLELVAVAQNMAPPVAAPWLVLFETTHSPDAFEQLTSSVGRALDVAGLADAPVAAARDVAAMRALWVWRDAATESIARRAAERHLVVTKLDVTLPTQGLAAFARDLEQSFRGRPEKPLLFGHVGDGNLHVNVLARPSQEGHTDELEDTVLRLVAAHHGSISAEHGIGRAKAPWLGLVRTPAELSAMRALKDALDPAWRLGRAIWEITRMA